MSNVLEMLKLPKTSSSDVVHMARSTKCPDHEVKTKPRPEL